jgi:hypothetical protein
MDSDLFNSYNFEVREEEDNIILFNEENNFLENNNEQLSFSHDLITSNVSTQNKNSDENNSPYISLENISLIENYSTSQHQPQSSITGDCNISNNEDEEERDIIIISDQQIKEEERRSLLERGKDPDDKDEIELINNINLDNISEMEHMNMKLISCYVGIKDKVLFSDDLIDEYCENNRNNSNKNNNKCKNNFLEKDGKQKSEKSINYFNLLMEKINEFENKLLVLYDKYTNGNVSCNFRISDRSSTVSSSFLPQRYVRFNSVNNMYEFLLTISERCYNFFALLIKRNLYNPNLYVSGFLENSSSSFSSSFFSSPTSEVGISYKVFTIYSFIDQSCYFCRNSSYNDNFIDNGDLWFENIKPLRLDMFL